MSKPVKEMVRRELAGRLKGLSSLAMVGFTGLDAIATNRIRSRLRSKGIKLLVVKNSLARQAFKAVGLDVAVDLIDGPCAVAYGSENLVGVVRELIDIGKESPQLTVKAALLEGEIFRGDDRVKALSRFPTREEAVAGLSGCLIFVCGSLAGCLVAPGAQVAALIKAIEEKAASQEAASANAAAPGGDAQGPAEQAADTQAPAAAEASQAEAPASQEKTDQGG
jgi:large subunit ribosomal protein L10